MTIKKIVIRCITDEKKGFGNLNRSILLATYLRSKKFKVTFIINNSKNAIIQLKKFKFQCILLPDNYKISQEHIFISKFLLSIKTQFLIIDMREFTEILSKNLRKYNLRILILDDAWCKIVYSDVLINATPIKQYHKYKKINPTSKLFLGPKYWIMQKNFSNYLKPISEIKSKKMYNLTITLGGSDPSNLTKNILDSIMVLENIKITVIFGPFFNNSEIKKIKSKYPKINYHHNLTNPLVVFKKSDLVISSSGNTLFELAILGIPTISIPIVDHQILYSKFFEKIGFSKNLGKWNNKKPSLLRLEIISILDNTQIRKKMSRNGKNFCDGKGGFRISSQISNMMEIS